MGFCGHRLPAPNHSQGLPALHIASAVLWLCGICRNNDIRRCGQVSRPHPPSSKEQTSPASFLHSGHSSPNPKCEAMLLTCCVASVYALGSPSGCPGAWAGSRRPGSGSKFQARPSFLRRGPQLGAAQSQTAKIGFDHFTDS